MNEENVILFQSPYTPSSSTTVPYSGGSQDLSYLLERNLTLNNPPPLNSSRSIMSEHVYPMLVNVNWRRPPGPESKTNLKETLQPKDPSTEKIVVFLTGKLSRDRNAEPLLEQKLEGWRIIADEQTGEIRRMTGQGSTLEVDLSRRYDIDGLIEEKKVLIFTEGWIISIIFETEDDTYQGYVKMEKGKRELEEALETMRG